MVLRASVLVDSDQDTAFSCSIDLWTNLVSHGGVDCIAVSLQCPWLLDKQAVAVLGLQVGGCVWTHRVNTD